MPPGKGNKEPETGGRGRYIQSKKCRSVFNQHALTMSIMEGCDDIFISDFVVFLCGGYKVIHNYVQSKVDVAGAEKVKSASLSTINATEKINPSPSFAPQSVTLPLS